MRNWFSNSTTWRSRKRTTAALRTLFSLLHAFLTALRSCACVHRISCSLQSSFRSGVSTPTSPWSPSFLGWDHQFSGPHDGCGECGFHVVHTAASRRVCPEVPSNRCGHLLSKLGISHQVPTVHWWFRCGPQPAVSSKIVEEFDGCGHNVWSEMGRKEG